MRNKKLERVMVGVALAVLAVLVMGVVSVGPPASGGAGGGGTVSNSVALTSGSIIIGGGNGSISAATTRANLGNAAFFPDGLLFQTNNGGVIAHSMTNRSRFAASHMAFTRSDSTTAYADVDVGGVSLFDGSGNRQHYFDSGGWKPVSGSALTLMTPSALSLTTNELITVAIPVATVSPTFFLTNSTPATAGNQAYSPFLHFGANGWKTTATAASQPVAMRMGLVPVQAATSPTSFLVVDSSTNSSTPFNVWAINSNGDMTNKQNFYFGNGASLTGPNGTSQTKLSAGTTQLLLDATTTVDVGFAGTAYYEFTTQDFTPQGTTGSKDLGSSSQSWRTIWNRNTVRLASNQSVANATLTTATLSLPSLVNGFNYRFHFMMAFTNTVNAEGIAIDMGGGNSSWTSLNIAYQLYDDTGFRSATNVTLESATFRFATIAGRATVMIDGCGVCAGSGALTPRFAKNTHTSGTITNYASSYGEAMVAN